jgi:hypothetical protein
MEQRAVHRARQSHRIGEAAPREVFLQLARGDQGRIPGVVETAHPAQRDRFEETETVIAHVMVEARMQARCDRNAETACHAPRRPAEWTFGRDVDRIRPLRAPMPRERAQRRRAETQSGIARQRKAANEERVVDALAVVRLPRTHQVDRMPART